MLPAEPVFFKPMVEQAIEDSQPAKVFLAYDLDDSMWKSVLGEDLYPYVMGEGPISDARVEKMGDYMKEASSDEGTSNSNKES